MKWHNSPLPWSEMERVLSGRAGESREAGDADGTGSTATTAESRTPGESGEPGIPSRPDRSKPTAQPHVPYAELHAHSHYSFLDGASSPEALVQEAIRLGLSGLAITDHDGFQGAPRFAEAAATAATTAAAAATAARAATQEAATTPLRFDTVYGAELSLDLDAPQLGIADPMGTHLLVLANGVSGYHRLSSAITEAQLAGLQKGRPVYDLDALAAASNHEWTVLTGCRKGAVRQALAWASNRTDGEAAAARELDRLTALFGRDHVFVELTDHGHPGNDVTNDRLAVLAARAGLPTVVTGAVHAATREDTHLAEAMSAIRSRRSLDQLDPFLPASGAARLRSGRAMLRRFARHPDAVTRTAVLAGELAFPLKAATPKLPHLEVPAGYTQMGWLRELVAQGAERRYRMPDAAIAARLEKELAVIEQQDFPGYFLVVYDIVQFARNRGILCQGRGSAANSAVCYVLGITDVDSIGYRLPFERFLSSMREEEPDIDVDFDSDRREEVIQYVYEKYGRHNAAQVANVISYRPKNAVRDAAKALGYDAEAQRRFTKGLDRGRSLPEPKTPEDSPIPDEVRRLANRLLGAPRHLGIHSGGMVLTERPVGEVCPIEHARMPGRTVLQWDKDDCASMGLVKFDLLGLGMLSALQRTMDLAEEATGERWTLATLPKEEPGVYDMLCRADAIGVFQLESRAQLNTLPRLRPREFYDLVIEIAMIRPGPLQGGAIHPYLRRRNSEEPVSYPHPILEDVLKRTLGVPLFQEQLMQMAQAVGGCSAEDADLLRRAMGSKRGKERIDSLRAKLFAGMRENGIKDETAAGIYAQIESFANFGFAESHSISFALLVYASAWFKLHYPAAFLIGLLRSQPMGFYSPRSLVEDARRHGVEVLSADVQHPAVSASLEARHGPGGRHEVHETSEKQAVREDHARPPHRRPPVSGRDACVRAEQPPVGAFERDAPDDSATHRRDAAYAVRLGLGEIRGVDVAAAERIVAAHASAPFADLADLARRADLSRPQLEALATAGACAGLGLHRREALWDAGPASDNRERFLPGIAVHVQPPLLPLLSEHEQTALDLWSTGIVAGKHPLALLRDRLDARQVTRSDALRRAPHRSLVRVAGLVTHRQRPSTASGVTFLTLEDETGTTNIVTWTRVWEQFRRIARESPALFVTGTLERTDDGLVNVIAAAFEPLEAPEAVTSRDFQ